jgi:signal transduction histidine kinase
LAEALTDDITAAARVQASEVAATLGSAADPWALGVAEDDEQLVQVLGPDGDVVASSANVAGRAPVVMLRAGQSAELPAPLADAADFVAVAVEGPAGGKVIVARSLEHVTESTRAVTSLLAVGLPLLLALVAGTTWLVVGRALAPVDAIRAEVDEISGRDLHRRIREPPRQDEISRLAVTMNHMLGRLESASRRQRRFVSDASHELRSPVASIRQHTEVALAHPARTTVSDLAATVLGEDLRMQVLVENLLLLARADEGVLAAAGHIVDLDDLVFAEVRRLRGTAAVDVDAAGVCAGRVHGSALQLRSLVANLLDNAARHAGACVVIGLTEHDDRQSGHAVVVLRVDDDGGGIATEDRVRIFHRFVRLDDARSRSHGGAGLGLAIVAEVAGAHGGTVVATDAPSGGARFEVRLPALAD